MHVAYITLRVGHRSCAISQMLLQAFLTIGKEGIRLAWCNAWFMAFVVSGLLLVRWNLLKTVVCAMARDRGVRGGRESGENLTCVAAWGLGRPRRRFDTAMVAHGYELADQGCPVCVLCTPQFPSNEAEFAARVERRAVGRLWSW